MRKWNHILAQVILILLALHGIVSCMQVLGLSTVSLWQLAYALLACVLVHAVFGVISTVPAIRTGRKSGKWYRKQNSGFWVKRLTGVAILLLLCFHLSAFTVSVNGQFFLREFTLLRLLSQLLFLAAIFLHVLVSVRSLLIAKGTLRLKERRLDWMAVLALFLVLFAGAIILYFIRWQM